MLRGIFYIRLYSSSDSVYERRVDIERLRGRTPEQTAADLQEKYKDDEHFAFAPPLEQQLPGFVGPFKLPSAKCPPDLEFMYGYIWPEGVPDGSKTPLTAVIPHGIYMDDVEGVFIIGYTADQMQANRDRHNGVFVPFEPELVNPPVTGDQTTGLLIEVHNDLKITDEQKTKIHDSAVLLIGEPFGPVAVGMQGPRGQFAAEVQEALGMPIMALVTRRQKKDGSGVEDVLQIAPS
ncbi:hypothetical protein LCGC14_0163150 [marine sediment metagenome]|uniref:Uncharacterized protein n=1 Tax=marine sediment metagenome TaxID=412755 RepID=A0A0F9XCE3_9ZZZZ